MSFTPQTPKPLLMEELFDVILHFLAEPSRYEPYSDGRGIWIRTPDPDGRRALAVLARTCRGFSEPSLKYLWRKLSSLEPLVRCYTPSIAVLAVSRCVPPPSLADWAVINRYSHWVEELEVQNDISCTFLTCVMFEPALLPNLRALKWKTLSNSNTFGITHILPLLSPGLVALDVGAVQHDSALSSFLKACPLRCPRLKTVGFHIYVHGVELVDILSRTVCSFKNLQRLTLEAPISESALRQLLMSSELQELTLHLRQIFVPPSVVPLRNIKKLDLMLNNLRPIVELLRPGDQSFREITIRLHSIEFAESISSFLAQLAARPPKSSLQSLRLNNVNTALRSHLQDCNLFALSFDTFRPITALTNIRELIVRLENPVALNDEELVDLVQNWPLLRVLELCYDRRFRAKHVTFKGLLSLVAICPNLQAVGLTLDGREVPTGVPTTSGSGYKSITSLRFFNSPIDNPPLVAEFLLAYFPSVTSIANVAETYQWRPGVALEKYAEDWAEVQGYLGDALEQRGRASY